MYNYCILYIPVFVQHQKKKFISKYLWRMAQNFCGAPISVTHAAPCATECANVTPSPHISVAHAARCATDSWTFCGAPGTCATEIYFSGEISVAHPPGPGVRHRYLKWCATDSCFSSSVFIMLWRKITRQPSEKNCARASTYIQWHLP